MNGKNIVWHKQDVSKESRSSIKAQKPCIVWFTGLSGSGKSTIANAVEKELFRLKKHTYLLDGDNIRMGLNRGLGFSDIDRVENIRRIGEVSKLFVDSGLIVLTAFISPFIKDRDMVKSLVKESEFIEVFVDTPLNVCEERDTKGLYKKARAGEITNFTGISSIYESPINADIIVDTEDKSVNEVVVKIIDYLKVKGYLDA